jgi:hypothetical protein
MSNEPHDYLHAAEQRLKLLRICVAQVHGARCLPPGIPGRAALVREAERNVRRLLRPFRDHVMTSLRPAVIPQPPDLT